MLEAFDSGEELEDHEKDQDETSEDNGVDIALDADKFGEYVAEIREKYDGRHTTPDDESDAELQDRLMVLAFEIIVHTLIEHEACENEDDDLVELKCTEVHRLVVKK